MWNEIKKFLNILLIYVCLKRIMNCLWENEEKKENKDIGRERERKLNFFIGLGVKLVFGKII